MYRLLDIYTLPQIITQEGHRYGRSTVTAARPNARVSTLHHKGDQIRGSRKEGAGTEEGGEGRVTRENPPTYSECIYLFFTASSIRPLFGVGLSRLE